jgi:hypothetical protein
LVPLTTAPPEAGVIEIFFAIFAHRPVWMNLLLIARNKVAGFAGLETPTTSEILEHRKERSLYRGTEDLPLADLLSGAGRIDCGAGQQAYGFPAVDYDGSRWQRPKRRRVYAVHGSQSLRVTRNLDWSKGRQRIRLVAFLATASRGAAAITIFYRLYGER